MNTITQNVTDLIDSDKQSLEHLLGASLNETQQVTIMAFTPGQIPSPAARLQSERLVEQILAKAHEHRIASGFAEEDIDSAVDAAMDAIRRRPSS